MELYMSSGLGFTFFLERPWAFDVPSWSSLASFLPSGSSHYYNNISEISRLKLVLGNTCSW